MTAHRHDAGELEPSAPGVFFHCPHPLLTPIFG